MKKKLYLVFGLLFLVTAGLSGCANKYNSVPLHSVKYYEKHQKQMTATINKCNKVEANLTAEAEKEKSLSVVSKFQKTTLYKDCSNATAAQDYIGEHNLLKGAEAGW